MNNLIVMLGSGLSPAERTSTAGIVTLQGMLTIFAVLAILWGATEIMHRLMHREKNSKKQKAHDMPVAETAASEPSVVAQERSEDTGAIIAAITAAITAARADEGNDGAFRVVSFKRAEGSGRRKNF